MATKLNTLNLLALPNLVTPSSGFVSFGAKSDGLYQKVGTVETKLSIDGHTHTIDQITGLQGALDSKATPSDISTAVNNLEIGGRNLIIGSFNDWRSITVFQFGAQLDYIPIQDDWRGKTVTHSFEVKDIPEGESVRIRIDFCRPDDTYTIHIYGNIVNLAGKSFVSFTVPTDTQYNRIRARVFPVNYTANYNVLFRCEKLEFGTKATDWTPAPEDQVSDWSVTDVNSFAFIKNKPTQLSQFTDNIGVASHIANKANPHNVTASQVGALPLTGGTLSGDLIMNKSSSSSPWPNSINSDPNNYINLARLSINIKNNGLHFFGDGGVNARRFGIQSGHESPLYASAFGILELNPFGGVVRINGITAATVNSNVASATKLQTPRTIAGVSFDGSKNIDIPFANLASKPTTLSGYGITDGVTTNTTQTITGAKTFSTLLTASAGVTTPKVDFGNGFTVEPSGTELVFKYNGVIKQRMLSDGSIVATGELTSYVAAT